MYRGVLSGSKAHTAGKLLLRQDLHQTPGWTMEQSIVTQYLLLKTLNALLLFYVSTQLKFPVFVYVDVFIIAYCTCKTPLIHMQAPPPP